ncbi:MAG: hypothetical protein QW360_02920, partial [Thermofilum sp.]
LVRVLPLKIIKRTTPALKHKPRAIAKIEMTGTMNNPISKSADIYVNHLRVLDIPKKQNSRRTTTVCFPIFTVLREHLNSADRKIGPVARVSEKGGLRKTNDSIGRNFL